MVDTNVSLMEMSLSLRNTDCHRTELRTVASRFPVGVTDGRGCVSLDRVFRSTQRPGELEQETTGGDANQQGTSRDEDLLTGHDFDLEGFGDRK
jgi:hypothetical protein